MTLLEFANRFRSLPDDPEDRAGWKTCIGVCQRPFGGEWTVFCGTDMALDDILEEGYVAGAFDGPEAASIRPYLPHGNRVNAPVFLLELGRLTDITLIGKHEPGTLAGKIADALEVLAGLPGYVQWLRRFAKGAEDQYQNAADKKRYTMPLVEFPRGGEAHFAMFAGNIGSSLSAALKNGVFKAKCFDGLRGRLLGLPHDALEELMKFLIGKSYQFPGPAHEDITKLADALESIGQEKEATAQTLTGNSGGKYTLGPGRTVTRNGTADLSKQEFSIFMLIKERDSVPLGDLMRHAHADFVWRERFNQDDRVKMGKIQKAISRLDTKLTTGKVSISLRISGADLLITYR